MLKIKSKPGIEPVVLNCNNYPSNDDTQWGIFGWLLERSVISDTREMCGFNRLTTTLNKTGKEQSRFVNQMPLQERCSIGLRLLNGCP
jgi:hypothetical protein